MKKVCLLFTFSVNCILLLAQTVGDKLAKAVSELEKDPQMEAALVSLYVMDADNGSLVYEKNSRYGMAPASTQKLFTAAAILELLGEKFRYKTAINLYEYANDPLKSGMIEIRGSGDPSLGSWRYAGTKKEALLKDWSKALVKAGSGLKLTSIYLYDLPPGNMQTIPDGYIWQDMGNYYGAGTSLLNWNENQYDIVFRSGATGTPATIIGLDTMQKQLKYRFSVFAGAAGSGDNTYIYAAPFAREAVVNGTIPPNQRSFTISGSMPDAGYTLALSLQDQVALSGGIIDPKIQIHSSRGPVNLESADPVTSPTISSSLITSISHSSPILDSLVFWFLRKSINLYGEAFVKTIAYERKDGYRLDKGLDHITNFWTENGIRKSEISLLDGSGLSPQNRVTTRALCQVLKYSAGRSWFPAFQDAIPTYNGMKMKSGSINGARAFAGYHKSAKGKKYIFAMVVNNYNGNAGEVVKKMYDVLDLLK
ncbi:D-alanyl-D-alanine carboxypeptidase/D-alanyl-D-alanine endopeptidase [Flavitalea sp.]|nr:D-alanyl-D-alanine carboxypeptidase/D-alanyl-D-alanine-endopeptidase [Flavitalea sp.]